NSPTEQPDRTARQNSPTEQPDRTARQNSPTEQPDRTARQNDAEAGACLVKQMDQRFRRQDFDQAGGCVPAAGGDLPAQVRPECERSAAACAAYRAASIRYSDRTK
ncbi:MAG: hypothetical protein OXC07_10280, partial [Kistimonas sp.]|nr:hypothetical protein [Kistimonas sp.]